MGRRLARWSAIAVLLSACGGTTGSPSAMPAQTPSPTPNGALARPADAVLADADKALAGATSFHMKGMITDGITLDTDIAGSTAHGFVAYGDFRWEYVVRDGRTFFRGRSLWASTQSAAVAAKLGDAWVAMPGGDEYWSLPQYLQKTARVLTGSVFGPHPDLVNQGARTVDGVATDHLANASDAYDIAAVGTPWPVMWVDVREPACGITISNVGKPVDVPATDGALDLTASGASTTPLPTPTPRS